MGDVSVRYGRRAARGRLPKRSYLVVIYEREGEDFIVITALKTKGEGARKYGFT